MDLPGHPRPRARSSCLVDELAHTNAPGVEHAKRYEDIRDLLDAGIDVFSTVNVQHLESLNDQVAELTGVRVRETFPDALLAEADEVVLIDVTPEALIARLREGKVYPAARVPAALNNFFRIENLQALREVALRQVAEEVEAKRLVRDPLEVREAELFGGRAAGADRRAAAGARHPRRLRRAGHPPRVALGAAARRGARHPRRPAAGRRARPPSSAPRSRSCGGSSPCSARTCSSRPGTDVARRRRPRRRASAAPPTSCSAPRRPGAGSAASASRCSTGSSARCPGVDVRVVNDRRPADAVRETQ